MTKIYLKHDEAKPRREIKPLWLKCRCGKFAAADFPKVMSYLERLVFDPEKKPKAPEAEPDLTEPEETR
jgi:hypothetical protein